MYNNKHLTSIQSVMFLLFSLALNCLGNGLTVATNMGSPVWTASAANLSFFFNQSIGIILVIYGIVQIIINCALLKEISFQRIFGNLLFVLFFGTFVAFFAQFFIQLGIPKLPLIAKIILVLFGVSLVAIAVSIYQRVNLILHPCDEMTNIIRFKYVNGDAKKAQIINFAIPAVVILLIGAVSQHLVAVNIGTIFAFFFQGTIIGLSDQKVIPKLSHKPLI